VARGAHDRYFHRDQRLPYAGGDQAMSERQVLRAPARPSKLDQVYGHPMHAQRAHSRTHDRSFSFRPRRANERADDCLKERQTQRAAVRHTGVRWPYGEAMSHRRPIDLMHACIRTMNIDPAGRHRSCGGLLVCSFGSHIGLACTRPRSAALHVPVPKPTLTLN
jgi:hypothetical protein